MTIDEVVIKYFREDTNFFVEKCKGGSINETYKVVLQSEKTKQDFVLQKMNKIFDSSVVDDVVAITEYLTSKNIQTKRIVKTKQGKSFVADGESWWKMTTYLSGVSFLEVFSKTQIKSAGEMVGRFHNALIDCKYEFKFNLPHYHTDTSFYMTRLQDVLEQNVNSEKYFALKDIAKEILSFYKNLPKLPDLPKRIVHGDLKISNVLFEESGEKAVALMDLDTLMRGDIPIELGDALRSWCMPGGEDTDIVTFNKDFYDQALSGYFSMAEFLTAEEKQAIPLGVKIITLELSARFLADAFEEKYFKLNSTKYKNTFEQNKNRAINQLVFFKEFSRYF